ncbi:hypothetical protein [Pedobacter nototheniae]|uniref:hypothetical protein n=1 Tax=Pedobacter nototheniae TaxID=2488994 RepID=UPI002931DBE8|nr:hypothetical protein [Pedobacter nototheniae]
MKTLILASFIFLFGFTIKAQTTNKIENDILFGKGCYYIESLPEKNNYAGVLFLIPGFLESPVAVMAQSTIVQTANKNNIAVVMVNLTLNNEDFPIDKKCINLLNKMIGDFYQKRKIQETTDLYIGGFSIGGTAALRFYTNKNKEIKINKVFAIDPPLDMVRLRKSLLKGRESSFVSKIDVLNTSNKPQQESLVELSVYNPDFTDVKALPSYSSTPLRIYCEPDILWWMENRNMDLSDMNVTDCAGYINKLRQNASDNKVELILTKDRGIRNNTQKHPHSWSIAEAADLIKWLLEK